MHVDLTTKYLGLSFNNPVVASAGPLTGDIDSLHRLEQLGVGGVAFPSFFTSFKKVFNWSRDRDRNCSSKSATVLPSPRCSSIYRRIVALAESRSTGCGLSEAS